MRGSSTRSWVSPKWKATLTAAVVLAAWLVGAGVAAAATTPEQKCQDGVANAGIKYFGSVVKTVSKCEQQIAAGALPDTTNCRPLAGVVDDAATDKKLGKARDALDKGIRKRCTGLVLADVGIGAPCDQAATLALLFHCISEQAHGLAAEDLIETIFDSTGDISAANFDATRSCQATLAKEAGKYATARLKERRSCGKKFVAGKIEGTCPTAKSIAKLDKARTKFFDKVGAVCGDTEVSGLNGLTLGFPCDLFAVSTFDRGGPGLNNLIPVADRFSRCMAAAAAGAGDIGADTSYPLPDPNPFFLGVAAGDATATAFMTWTRTNGAGAVTLEVATDPEFAVIVDTQNLTADAAADDTVKTEVLGLTASTQYYYRFSQGGETSRTGRIRTAPPGVSTAPFTFSFTGDSNAYFKPFSVMEQITTYDPDVWLYIGDTIYGDDPRSGSGVATVRADYHDKYEENRSDRALRDALASVGFYAIWDDHEVTNDFWGTDPAIQAQMAEGNQAFRDYMPVREDGVDPQQLYRSFRWGYVAEFFLIDDRQYRDPQAYITESECIEGLCSVTGETCTNDTFCDNIQAGQVCHQGTCSDTGDPCSLQLDCDLIQAGQACVTNGPATLPNTVCKAEIDNPARTYLGATQLQWLEDGLSNSPATFKFIMNGPLVSNLLFVPYDRWEGYTAERQDLLDYVTTNSISNVMFLSTDIHAAIINDNVLGSGVREAVAGAIGMDPIVRELPASLVPLVGTLPVLFPTVSFYDIDRFTVANAEVSTTSLTMRWQDNTGQVLKELVVPALP